MEVLRMLPPGASVVSVGVLPISSPTVVAISPAASLTRSPLPLPAYTSPVGSVARISPLPFATSFPFPPVTSVPLSGRTGPSPYSSVVRTGLAPLAESPARFLFSDTASVQHSARTSQSQPELVSHTVTVPKAMPAGTVATYHLAQEAFERQEKGIELDVPSEPSDLVEAVSADGVSRNGWNHPEQHSGLHTPIPLQSPIPNYPERHHGLHTLSPYADSLHSRQPAALLPYRAHQLPVNDPHLLFGGIPKSYGTLEPPPLPDLFPPEPEPEPEIVYESFELPQPEPELIQEPEPVFIPPPPPKQEYKMPGERAQPYFYAHHAPLAPPGYRPGDDAPATYSAHRQAANGGHGFQRSTQHHVHVQHTWHTDRRRSSHQSIPIHNASRPGQLASLPQHSFPGTAAAPLTPTGPVSPRTHMAMVAFEKFDTDHSGNLDVREFHKAIVSLGLGYSFEDAENLFNMMDEDGNGSMSMQEFLAHCREYINNSVQAAAEEAPKDPEAQARQAFHRFDRNRDGFLDVNDFLQAIRELGLGTTMEDAEQLFSMVDEDGSGTMDEEEFVSHCISAFQNAGAFGAGGGGGGSSAAARPAPTGAVKISGDPTADAANLFRRYDEDGNGYLDIYEFMRAMKELGLGLTFEDAKALFSQIDVDGSGMMDEEEFTTHYINHIVKQRRG